jgi:uncharacterized protein YggE
MLAAFLLAVTLNAFKEFGYIGSNIIPTNTISVSGEGEVFAKPDTGSFTFSITEDANAAAAVQKTVADKAGAIVTALKENGVDEKDIKTITYELYPRYEWVQERCVAGFSCPGKEVQNGFRLTETISVKVRNTETAGTLMALVTEKGATNVGGLSFMVDDEDVPRAEARKAAIEDAKAKADQLAADLGVTIVRMVSFSESAGYTPMPYYAKDMMMADSMGGAVEEAVVPTGENHITSNVTIVYEVR